ncbi:MAG TPA: DegT/DnrJ/EryC1/StrS family aminotransferase [Ignavibacteria bacterium]|nr:DegT/DnrJ/EryC1/StrS family aminotransferase [Ignavibacteria bacterium]HMQ97568.1 DegT/DnrJ/EryC1/StrS family aminotransferase [Ignavibacteria bacterium]
MKKPLYVTRSFLPPLDEYTKLLKDIWASGVLTNDGKYLRQLEQKLKKLSGCSHALCVSNGTIALQAAIKALDINGEIITTPYSFIATTSSIVWEGSEPVYADIDPGTLNIDPSQIVKKITRKTKAILAVHVYGNPCDTSAIGKIAKEYGLKLIYDASHAIGINYKGKPLFAYGDVSTTSFHATKIINTAEGGAVFTNSSRVARELAFKRNFGYSNYKILSLGINGKMSELNAALGVAGFKYLGYNLKKRKAAFELYRKLLKDNFRISYQEFNAPQNFAYFPVIFSNNTLRENTVKALNKENIFPREYFSPSLELVYGKKITCPVSYDISRRVLCLPLSVHITASQIKLVTRIVNKACGV